jgi:hypothetical protein
MSSPLPWSNPTPMPPSNDATELLRRLNQNTADLLWWMKVLVGAVIVLVLVNVAFL